MVVNYAKLGQAMKGRMLADLTSTSAEAQQNLKRQIEFRRPGKASVEDDAFGFVSDEDEEEEDECIGAAALRSDEGKLTVEKDSKPNQNELKDEPAKTKSTAAGLDTSNADDFKPKAKEANGKSSPKKAVKNP